MAQEPFGGTPQQIPGRIEAEDFDVGGEGVSFHETDPKASWSIDYREEPVDIKQATDNTEDIIVGRFLQGEWLEYTVDVEPGLYDIIYRSNTINDGVQLRVNLGTDELAVLDIPNTGSWDERRNVRVPNVQISGDAGQRILRLEALNDGVDIDCIDFVESRGYNRLNTIKITNDGSSGTSYDFTVSGGYLEHNTEEGSVQSNDGIEGKRAFGGVGGGTDAFDYLGGVTSFIYNGPVPTVWINGTEVDPDALGEGVGFDMLFKEEDIEYLPLDLEFRRDINAPVEAGYGTDGYGEAGYGET